MNCYVYRHIRKDTGVPFYIGVGTKKKNFITVLGEYKRAYSNYKRNPVWRNIVAKADYEVEILCDNLTKQEASEKEKEFIQLYGRRLYSATGLLCNFTVGGDGVGGHSPSAETRRKLSKRSLGKKKPVWTEEQRSEHRLRMQKIHCGKKWTSEQLQIRNLNRFSKVRCITNGKIFDNCADAALSLFGDKNKNHGIILACNGHLPHYRGLCFEYTSPQTHKHTISPKKTTPVLCVTNGIYYNSARDAATKLFPGTSLVYATHGIFGVCNGFRKSYHRFIFKYL